MELKIKRKAQRTDTNKTCSTVRTPQWKWQ